MLYWLDKLARDYESTVANVFLAYGNVDDLQVIGSKGHENIMPFSRCVQNYFVHIRKNVAIYDIASGWKFNRKEAMALVERIVTAHKDNYVFSLGDEEEEDNEFKKAPVGQTGTRAFNINNYKHPVDAIKLMKMVCEHSNQWAFYIRGVETFLQTTDWGANREADIICTAMEVLLSNERFLESGNILMLTAQDISKLHPFLKSFQSRIDKLYIPQPDFKIRKKFIELTLEGGVDIDPDEEEEEDTEETTTEENLEDGETHTVDFPNPQILAGVTAGLTLRMIDECILLCRHEGEYVEKYFMDKKKQFIAVRFGEIIEIKTPKSGFETVGGLSKVKKFMKNNIITPMIEGNKQRVPMGVLFGGPPGTGKSVMAEATAYEAGVLYAEFRLSKIFSKYVGESEKQLDIVLEMLETLAPVIVFMDEIDQSGHRRDNSQSGDSGVSQRVFQRLLQFMADTSHRGTVCFLAATNRPDLLDPAMKRAGRFDKRIPFLAPNASQRVSIIKALCHKNGLKLKGEISDKFINATDGYVGADLEALVNTAYELADDRTPGAKKVLAKDLLEARRYIYPSISKEQVDYMTKLAIEDCNDIRLLPKNYGRTD